MSRKRKRRIDDAPQIPASPVKSASEDPVDTSRAAGARKQSTLDALSEAGAGVAAKE